MIWGVTFERSPLSFRVEARSSDEAQTRARKKAEKTQADALGNVVDCRTEEQMGVDWSVAQPERTFLQLYKNKDGTVAKCRTSLEDVRNYRARFGHPPGSTHWRYEVKGEPGVFPTMDEWNAIHGEGRCESPCKLCEANGHEGATKGLTKDTRSA